MAFLRVLTALVVNALLLSGTAVATAAPDEYQVKAVFLFNFSRFVEWPQSAFANPEAPFVIGVLGQDPFGKRLEEATRGETVDGRPLVVRRVRSAAEAGDCQILFIHRSADAQVGAILASLADRSTLTVSDSAATGERGVMIGLVTDKDRIRLRINVDSARAAHLTISSKLLRSAEIVRSAAKEG